MGNQPVFTPLEEGKDDPNLNNRPSGANGSGLNQVAYSFEDDISSLPFISMGNDQFPGRDMQDDGYSYTPDLNCTPYPMIDKNWIDMKSDLSESCTDYEMLPSELGMRGDGADFLMSPGVNFMDYGKTEITTNCNPPKCETGTGYPIKIHGAEAQNSKASRLQMSEQFSSGCSAPLLPRVENFGARGNKNDINIVPVSSSSQQKVDRNYLTLGLGGGTKFRPNSNFSTREISNKLQEVSSPCNILVIGSCPKNIDSVTQMAGGVARSQTHAGELSKPYSSFSTQKIPSKLHEVSSHIDNSSIGHCPKNRSSLAQMSYGDARIQTYSGNSSISNCNFSAQEISNIGEGVSFQYNNSIDRHYPKNPTNLTQLAGGVGRTQTNTEFLRPAYKLANRMPNYVEGGLTRDNVCESTAISLPSGSTLLSETRCSSRPNIASAYLASHPTSSMNIPSESSRNYLSHRHKQSSTSHLRPGNHDSIAEVIKSEVGLSGSFLSSVQPVGGQFQQTPTYSSSVFPSIYNSSGQVVPVAKLSVRPQVAPNISRPPLKRKAVANPSALSAHRRKIFPQPVISDSTPQQRRIIPSISAPLPAAGHIPSTPLHVKWKGFDEAAPEPSGKRCLLCKRDISYTAEGLMYQPTTPPPVAVLPCGHTFHDHCLRIITPQDQSKNPPCIPCAVGEP